MKMKQPGLKSVFLRSDEVGCYHNNFLIAAVFEFFSDLEQQLDEGKHASNQETMKKSENLYD